MLTADPASRGKGGGDSNAEEGRDRLRVYLLDELEAGESGERMCVRLVVRSPTRLKLVLSQNVVGGLWRSAGRWHVLMQPLNPALRVRTPLPRVCGAVLRNISGPVQQIVIEVPCLFPLSDALTGKACSWSWIFASISRSDVYSR